MKTITTSIIPKRQTFAKVDAQHQLDLEAICVFAAIGFFLDQDTYWKDKIVLPPASNHIIGDNGLYQSSQPWFTWHYTPRTLTFDEALEEFSHLFESILKEQTHGKRVILPLSGGLDSRTQAVALKQLSADVFSYSYEFENGYSETKIAQDIAEHCNFDFKVYTISKGYLWSCIDDLAKLNECYSDFTSPRQMAIYSEFEKMGEHFSLGHWGDVLFDSMNLPSLSKEEQVKVLSHKLLKRGGLEFATSLWKTWQLSGNFEDYFYQRISALLDAISIDDTNARIRAFKSLYWAPRWTSVNLSVFESHHPISLPYYDERMCQFVCTLPEAYLKNRQLQIAYIKKRAPDLAKITWQAQRPFNLYNFQNNRMPYNLPFKIWNKTTRSINKAFGNSYVQRNWELQFLGEDNITHLKHYLFENGLESIVPKDITAFYFENFTSKSALNNAHAINMLLVLSKFNETQYRG